MTVATAPLPARGGPRLLIVRLGAVGDVVRTLPLASALRRAHPDALLGWLVEEASAPLLRELAAIDAVHVLPRREIARALSRPARLPSALRAFRALTGSLRAARYERVLDAHGTFKAAWAATLADAPVTGLAPGGSKELAHLRYDEVLPFPAVPMTRVRRALYLGAASGLLADRTLSEEATADFGLRFAPARVARATEALRAGQAPVVIFPFASAKGQKKRWPMERHAELAALLAARGRRVVVAWGSPREREEAAAALVDAPGVALAPPTDLVELTELLRGARVLVTGDTGPMHLAAAVGTPVVALFGPSDPVVNRPWGDPGTHGHVVVHRMPLSSLTAAEVLPHVLSRSG